MAETGFSAAPSRQGRPCAAAGGRVGIVPNIIVFQYNPETLSPTLTPWNPFEVDQAQRGSQAPTVQPFDVQESSAA